MRIAYLVLTILAALANGYAASLNFAGAPSVKAMADRLEVPRKSMVPLGALLAAGAAGLLLGLAVPSLGSAAAIGLVLYFVCALTVHIRARDRDVAGAICFLVLAVGALVTSLAYHTNW